MDPHSKSTEALERKMIIHVEVYSALSGLPKVAVYSCRCLCHSCQQTNRAFTIVEERRVYDGLQSNLQVN